MNVFILKSDKKGKVKKLKKQLRKETRMRAESDQRVCDLEFGLRNAEQAMTNAQQAADSANQRCGGLEQQISRELAQHNEQRANWNSERSTLQDDATRHRAQIAELTAKCEEWDALTDTLNGEAQVLHERITGLEEQLELAHSDVQALQIAQPTVYATREHEQLIQYAPDVFVARASYPDQQAMGPMVWANATDAQGWLDSLHRSFGPKEAPGDAQEPTQYPSTKKAGTLKEAASQEATGAITECADGEWCNDAHDKRPGKKHL